VAGDGVESWGGSGETQGRRALVLPGPGGRGLTPREVVEVCHPRGAAITRGWRSVSPPAKHA
jgi:hypothetical protein